MKALDYAGQFLQNYTCYKKDWDSVDGCILKGCADLYAATGDRKYRDFVIGCCGRFADGAIGRQVSAECLNASKALFFALDETGDERFRAAIEQGMERVRSFPRCRCGSFFYSDNCPYQVWLDGLYMVLPFYAAYEMRFGGKREIADIVKQFRNARENLFVREKGLYVPGWDESRTQPWCDRETGRSAGFFLRPMGQYLMALADCAGIIDEQLYEHRRALVDLFREAVAGLLPYADEKTGMFFRVIDRKDLEDNCTETSGTAMVSYAVMKGVRLGFLSAEKALPWGVRAFEGLLNEKLREKKDGSLVLTEISPETGPGGETNGGAACCLPGCPDDAPGAGPFMMALSEYLLAGKES